jgi:hypothetical protein
MRNESLKALLLPPKPECYDHRLEGYLCDGGDVDMFYEEVAKRIDALEASAVRVYFKDDPRKYLIASEQVPNDTHTALLICIEPLKKGVTKAEAVEAIRGAIKYLDDGNSYEPLKALADRIEKEGLRDE